RAMGSDGRDRVASSGGGDRAHARPNVRALASDVPAAFGTMRSKAPRGDSTDHLRYRRHRYCNRSPYACLRANFRALRGARVLGNGGPLCGGVAARPNPARTDGRFQVIFFAGRLSDYVDVLLADWGRPAQVMAGVGRLLVGPGALRPRAKDQPASPFAIRARLALAQPWDEIKS